MTLTLYILFDAISIFFMVLSDKYNTVKGDRTLQSKISRHEKTLRTSDFFLILSFIPLYLLNALRDGVGKDYNAYAIAFLKVNRGILTDSEKSWLGVGYRLLCKIVGLVNSESYALMFAVVGFITLYLWYKSIMNNSSSRALSLFILISFCLYYQTFNQSRQMLALSITTFAYKYIVERNLKKYVLFIFFACTIHPSAIVMIAPYILCKWKISFKNIFIYVATALGSYVMFQGVIKIVSYTNYGETYLNWTKYNVEYSSNSLLNLAIRIMLLVGCLIFAKKTIKRNPNNQYLYNMVIICTILQVLSVRSYLFGRVTTYFFIYYIFLIPEVVKTAGQILRNKVFVNFILIILMISYHFVYYFSNVGAVGSGYDIYKFLFF